MTVHPDARWDCTRCGAPDAGRFGLCASCGAVCIGCGGPAPDSQGICEPCCERARAELMAKTRRKAVHSGTVE